MIRQSQSNSVKFIIFLVLFKTLTRATTFLQKSYFFIIYLLDLKFDKFV